MTTPLIVRKLTEPERTTLQSWIASGDPEHSRRAQVILHSADGYTAFEISQKMGFHPDNLKKWIRKFNQKGLEGIEVLKRGPRSRFSDEQIDAILNIYNQPPLKFGLPFISWTPQKLALFVVKQGIVNQISHVTMRQILNGNEDFDDDDEVMRSLEPDAIPVTLPIFTPALAVQANHDNNGVSKSGLTVAELFSAGQNALRRNEYGEAIQLLQQLFGYSEMGLETEAQVRCLLNEAYEGINDYEKMLSIISTYEDAGLRNQLSRKMQARVKLRLGWAYARAANYAKAIARFNEARPIYIELDEQQGLGAVHYALGFVYIEINESKLAKEFLLKALENLRFSGDAGLLARVYIDLGLVSYQEGDFEGTKASYLKAQEYAEGLTDNSLLGLISMNLGAVYVDYGKRDEATLFFQRAVKEFTTSGQTHRLALAYNNLGNNLLRGGRWAEAAESLSKALEIARDLGHHEDTWLTLITLGELYFLKGENEKSEESLLTALKLLTEDDTGDKWAEAYAQRFLGRLYVFTNRPDRAMQALRTALHLTTRSANLYEVGLTNLSMAEHHIFQGSYDQAEEYLALAKENLKGKRNPDLSATGWAQRLAGRLSMARQELEEAKQHLSASINIFASINDKYELAYSHMEMGLLYLQMGEQSASRDNLVKAWERFVELGAQPALQRANDLLLALQKGEIPKTRITGEIKLNRDVLLMQRIIEAATSRDLLLKELGTIIYENFPLERLFIFGNINSNEIEPLVVLGGRQADALEVAPQVAQAISFGKNSLENATLQLLEDRVNARYCLYLQPRGGDGLELSRLKPLFKQSELALENCSLRSLSRSALVQDLDKVRAQTLIPGFIYASPAMQDVVERIQKIRASDTTVLITGESGTGKDLIARAVHAESSRRDSIFLPFNCTATPKDLIESQLFGHRRGAFTGATNNFQGIIRAADGGTLFLDEIGDLSLDVQPKLLRFLEAGEIQPLGEPKPMKVDVRVLAATNALLEKAVEEGRFREDLLYRLNIIRLHVPPLRERKEEIPLLATHYLQHFASRSGKKDITISQEVLHYFSNYNWPGNIRQLRTEIERLVAYSPDGTALTPRDLSPEIVRSMPTITTPINENKKTPDEILFSAKPASPRTLKEATDELERKLIETTLERTQYNISRAAKELGLSRQGLRLKMIQFGLDG